MVFIELLFSIYFVLFLIRLLVPDTGQMTFNQPYQFAVKLTRPIITVLAKPFPPAGKRAAPLLALGLLVLLQGFFYTSEAGLNRVYDCGFTRLVFVSDEPLWGIGKSLFYYLVLLYRVYAFLLLVVLLSPLLDSSDQFARLIKMMLCPLAKILKMRWLSLAVLSLIFSLFLVIVWLICQTIGWLAPQRALFIKAVFNAAVILVHLIPVLIFLIVVRVIFSWFAIFRSYRGPANWLELITDSFLRPFKKLNLVVEGFDLTPLAAIFILFVVQQLLLRMITGLYKSLAKLWL